MNVKFDNVPLPDNWITTMAKRARGGLGLELYTQVGMTSFYPGRERESVKNSINHWRASAVNRDLTHWNFFFKNVTEEIEGEDGSRKRVKGVRIWRIDDASRPREVQTKWYKKKPKRKANAIPVGQEDPMRKAIKEKLGHK